MRECVGLGNNCMFVWALGELDRGRRDINKVNAKRRQPYSRENEWNGVLRLIALYMRAEMRAHRSSQFI